MHDDHPSGPGEWAERSAHDRRADISRPCIAARSRIRTVSGREQAKRLDWIKPFTKVKNTSFAPGDVSIQWFEDGALNVSANCLDRHLATRGDKVAILWEGDDPTESRSITYRELHAEVSRFANVLKAARRQEGRPRHDLPADDPGSGHGDAGLHPHRRRSIRSSSAASRPTASPAASAIAIRSWSSPPMRACAAARRCR